MKKYLAQDKLTKAFARQNGGDLTCFRLFAKQFDTPEKAYKYMERYFDLTKENVEIIEIEG